MSVDQTGFVAFGIAIDDSLDSKYQYLNEDVYACENEEDEEGREIPECLNEPVKYYWDLMAKYNLDIKQLGECSDTIIIYETSTYKSAGRNDVLLLEKNSLKIQETLFKSRIGHFLMECGYTFSKSDIGWLVGCYQW